MGADGNAFEIHNNVTGGAQQQNIGQSGGEAVMHVDQRAGELTFERFVQTLREQIPPEQLKKAQAEIIGPLCEIAAEPEPGSEQDSQSLRSRIAKVLENLEPYSPYIRRTVAAFTEGALSTIPPPASWVIAGCIEVVRDARR